MNTEFKSLRDNVLAKIKTDHVAMRSRTYFAIKMIVLTVVVFSVLSISVFLCNFIFFAIEVSGSRELLGFGNRGVMIFIQIFPWWLLVIDIALIVLLEWLLRRFRFGYSSPVLYLLFGLLVVTISAAYTIERVTSVNQFLRDRAHERRLPPPMNDFYQHSGRPGGVNGSVCRCTITAIEGNVIYADDVDIDKTVEIKIMVPLNERMATTTNLAVGDVIVVAGDREGDTLLAFGIKKLPPGSSSVGPEHFGPPRVHEEK